MQNSSVINVKRHPLEMPLFVLSLLISVPVVALVIISVIGIFYALLLSFILFIGHITAINYIRGSGIRVTAQQLSEIYDTVERNAARIGLKSIPEIYVLQGNGMLNALATKFMFTRIFVIYSNLLDACENNPGARDMIIGHELGHMHAGHLRWSWLTWPSAIVPFLHKALSRAREYTADRYGYACVQNKQDALQGLLILAGGKNIASKISMQLFTEQLKTINTGMMRIGEWLHTHPTLVRRVCALDESLCTTENRKGSTSSAIKATLFVLITYIGFALMIMVSLMHFKNIVERQVAEHAVES